jgi:hypothetical protein
MAAVVLGLTGLWGSNAQACVPGGTWGVGPSLRDAPLGPPVPPGGNKVVVSAPIHVPAVGEQHAPAATAHHMRISPLASKAISVPRNASNVNIDSRVSGIGNDSGITGFYLEPNADGFATVPDRLWDGRGNFQSTKVIMPDGRTFIRGLSGPVYPDGRSDRRIIR